MNSLKEEVSWLYRDNYAHVVSMCKKRQLSNDDACDIAQEVFELYIHKRIKGEEIPDPCAWLSQTVKNQLNNHVRSGWNRLVDVNENFNHIMDEDELLRLCRESYAICEEIIQLELTDMQRNIFLLIGLHQFSYANVGRIYNLSYAQISKQYITASRIFIQALSKKGINNHRELL